MNPLCQKIALRLPPARLDDCVGDKERLLRELAPRLDAPVELPYRVLKTLYPLCRQEDWTVTATVVRHPDRWQVVRVEAGDTASRCFGYAVDLGSTTVVMELVDLSTGRSLAPGKRLQRPDSLGGGDPQPDFLRKKQAPAAPGAAKRHPGHPPGADGFPGAVHRRLPRGLRPAGGGGQHHHDPLSPGDRPLAPLPHPGGRRSSTRRASSRQRSWVCRWAGRSSACPRWPTMWAGTRWPASWPPASPRRRSPPSSWTSAPTGSWWWAAGTT